MTDLVLMDRGENRAGGLRRCVRDLETAKSRYEWKLADQGSDVSGMALTGGLLPIHEVGRLCSFEERRRNSAEAGKKIWPSKEGCFWCGFAYAIFAVCRCVQGGFDRVAAVPRASLLCKTVARRFPRVGGWRWQLISKPSTGGKHRAGQSLSPWRSPFFAFGWGARGVSPRKSFVLSNGEGTDR